MRLRPVPPAFSETISNGGPDSAWNVSTMRSRAWRDTPPWRNGAARPELLVDVPDEQVAHLPELREHQGPLVLVEQLGDEFVEPGELARPAGEP